MPDAPHEHGPGPPRSAHRVASLAQALSDAEHAAGSSPDRVARVGRLLAALTDVPRALAADPRRFAATAAGLRAAAASMLSGIVHPDARRMPGPHGDDWRALVAPFREEGLRLGLIKPRPYDDYAREQPPLPDGHHPYARPAGLYALHMVRCHGCRSVHTAGDLDASCPIHTLCALMEGVWPVWGPAGPPTAPTGPAALPQADDGLPDGDVAFAADAMDDLVTRGCGEWLTPAQAADPTGCAAVAPVWVVHSYGRTLQPGSAVQPPGAAPIDIPALARAARDEGFQEAEAFMRAAGGATPHDAAGRAQLDAAWLLSRGGKVGTTKRRLVERLDITANAALAHMGVSFPLASHTLVGAKEGDHLMADDAVYAYGAVRTHPDLARWLCTRCPRTGRVFRPLRIPFGYAQSCAAYCAFTAVIKDALRGPGATAATGGLTLSRAAMATLPELAPFAADMTDGLCSDMASGRAVVTGVVDDVLGRHDAMHARAAYDARAAAFAVAGYSRSAKKHRAGPSIVMLGLSCEVAGPDGRPTAAVQASKMAQILTDVAVWTRIGAARPADGYAPTKALEALVGDLQWLAAVDAGTALRIHGVRSALLIALTTRRAYAGAHRGAPCNAPLAAIMQRALDGRIMPAAIVPADQALSAFHLTIDRGPQGMQARAVPNGPAVSATFATDASLAEGVVRWGGITTTADGRTTTARGQRPAADGESSTSAELEAVAQMAEAQFHRHAGSTVVMVLDSLAATYALLKAKSKYGTPAFNALERTLLTAERHSIEILAIWVPRTLNTIADALTAPSPADARAAGA